VTIRKESLWALSNIASDSGPHIQALIDADVIPKVVSLLHTEDNIGISIEAVWVISNIIFSGKPPQAHYLFEQKAVEALCAYFQKTDEAEYLKVVLEAFQNILTFSEMDGCLKETRRRISTSGCRERMQEMVNHSDTSIAEGFQTLLEKYWDGDDVEDEDDALDVDNIDISGVNNSDNNQTQGDNDEQWG
jgi:hypothetical protein